MSGTGWIDKECSSFNDAIKALKTLEHIFSGVYFYATNERGPWRVVNADALYPFGKGARADSARTREDRVLSDQGEGKVPPRKVLSVARGPVSAIVTWVAACTPYFGYDLRRGEKARSNGS